MSSKIIRKIIGINTQDFIHNAAFSSSTFHHFLNKKPLLPWNF